MNINWFITSILTGFVCILGAGAILSFTTGMVPLVGSLYIIGGLSVLVAPVIEDYL